MPKNGNNFISTSFAHSFGFSEKDPLYMQTKDENFFHFLAFSHFLSTEIDTHKRKKRNHSELIQKLPVGYKVMNSPIFSMRSIFPFLFDLSVHSRWLDRKVSQSLWIRKFVEFNCNAVWLGADLTGEQTLGTCSSVKTRSKIRA